MHTGKRDSRSKIVCGWAAIVGSFKKSLLKCHDYSIVCGWVGILIMFMFQLVDIDVVSGARKFIKFVKLLAPHLNLSLLSTLGTCFEFKIVLLLDQLSPKAKEPGLPCYITYILWEKDGFITFSKSCCFPKWHLFTLSLRRHLFWFDTEKVYFCSFIV